MHVPIIQINIETMRESIMHAFTERQLDLSKEVKQALDLQCTPEAIQDHVNQASRDAVRMAVDQAVKRWWTTSEAGKTMIQEAVVKRMEEETEIYRGMR